MTMELSAEAYTAWQDEAQRERLLMDQLPQVRYIARRIHEHLPRHVPFEDLVHAGGVGVIGGLEVGSLRVESHLDGKEEDLCDSVPHDPQETPLFLCLRGEMKQQLARAIAELPEKERQVLVLYRFQELTMKEVGAVLGV